jgi:hypothetical protein
MKKIILLATVLMSVTTFADTAKKSQTLKCTDGFDVTMTILLINSEIERFKIDVDDGDPEVSKTGDFSRKTDFTHGDSLQIKSGNYEKNGVVQTRNGPVKTKESARLLLNKIGKNYVAYLSHNTYYESMQDEPFETVLICK